MKQFINKFSGFLFALMLIAPIYLTAQDEGKSKDEKEKKVKEGEQIIILRKGDKEEKLVVEIQGDKVTVNGKDVKDDGDNDVIVRRHKIRDVYAFRDRERPMIVEEERVKLFDLDENRAMLGVTTDYAEGGAEIQSVSEESAAEKAGLKKGDIIRKVDDTKIETPNDLAEAIRKHKPGDKVTVTFLRDKKEQKVTAELGKWKGVRGFGMEGGPNQFNFNLEDFNLQNIPRIAPPNMNWNWSGSGPKLGVSVQDLETGKGVKVIEVDEDGNAAKAGIKKDDIITEVDGKEITGTDQIASLVRQNRDKPVLKIKLLRKGKSEVVEVKIPRKLKTADL